MAWELNQIFLDIEKVREEARQKENRYLEIISQYEEQLKKYKEELHIYQRREEANQKTSKAEEARKGKKIKIFIFKPKFWLQNANFEISRNSAY